MLKGYKSYVMAGLVLLYGLTGLLTGHMTMTEALGVILSSGTIASLRAGISNSVDKWVFDQDAAVEFAISQDKTKKQLNN